MSEKKKHHIVLSSSVQMEMLTWSRKERDEFLRFLTEDFDPSAGEAVDIDTLPPEVRESIKRSMSETREENGEN